MARASSVLPVPGSPCSSTLTPDTCFSIAPWRNFTRMPTSCVAWGKSSSVSFAAGDCRKKFARIASGASYSVSRMFSRPSITSNGSSQVRRTSVATRTSPVEASGADRRRASRTSVSGSPSTCPSSSCSLRSDRPSSRSKHACSDFWMSSTIAKASTSCSARVSDKSRPMVSTLRKSTPSRVTAPFSSAASRSRISRFARAGVTPSSRRWPSPMTSSGDRSSPSSWRK